MNTKKTLEPKRKEGKIWSYVRHKWLVETPEETVRQNFLCTLVNSYGFSLDQIAEELSVVGRGSADARADFLIWKNPQEKIDGKTALIVVECKADNVNIDAKTYYQGANYAQYERAKFFVTHNNQETKYWKVDLARRMPNFDEIQNIPNAQSTDKEIESLLESLKIFKENEFADLLHQCHNIIRNREKKDPAAAFDEIAKVLFVKVWVEREMKRKNQSFNLFTADWLDSQLGDNPLNVLFQQTKDFYKNTNIFTIDEQINLKASTGREIVKLLEVYNLSDTSEDIKGIAFERFLGRTFRGEIGQFFTPRSIVEFMIQIIEPREGELICDPASGSGGFLIRAFEMIKQQILFDSDAEYEKYKNEIKSLKLGEDEEAALLRTKYQEIQDSINPQIENSRLWKLSRNHIFGCDANERMARTSKMNMIMHGDGHGGIYHGDGLINNGGIFEERFDIILTNPPFGSNVEPTDLILESDVTLPADLEQKYIKEFGEDFIKAREKTRSHINLPISSLFDITKSEDSKVKTEILFLERCINLLKPGGRMGIVLPEGICNNPSSSYIRDFCEDKGFVKLVVSLPLETFKSAGADVKAAILFFQKFTEEEKRTFDIYNKIALLEAKAIYEDEKNQALEIINTKNVTQSILLEDINKPTKEQKAVASEKAKSLNTQLREDKKEAKKMLQEIDKGILVQHRKILKSLFNYPIFLYEAEKVGINAIGEETYNELIPNLRLPEDINKSCLEVYAEFKETTKHVFTELI